MSRSSPFYLQFSKEQKLHRSFLFIQFLMMSSIEINSHFPLLSLRLSSGDLYSIESEIALHNSIEYEIGNH